jgi:hypothetical protein
VPGYTLFYPHSHSLEIGDNILIMQDSGLLSNLYAWAPQDLGVAFVFVFSLFPVLLFLFRQITAFYNANFHPLCKFPGPVAACRSETWLYQMMKSDFQEENFAKLHEKYSAPGNLRFMR